MDNGAGNVGVAQLHGGRNVMLVKLASMTVGANYAVNLVGNKPIVFLVQGSATINGHVARRRAERRSAGRRGRQSELRAGRRRRGDVAGTASRRVGRRRRRLRAAAAAGGGTGRGSGDGRHGGATHGLASLVPLKGGCNGGDGGHAETAPARAGFAGGAVQISAGGTLSVSANARVSAAGGGGGGGDNGSGAGGGGSGGAVLLEGRTLNLDASSWISASGGGGGEGADEHQRVGQHRRRPAAARRDARLRAAATPRVADGGARRRARSIRG